MKKLWLVITLLFVTLIPQISQAQYRYVPGIRVTVAPPPLRYEAAPTAPTPRHHWVAGHWAWRGNGHVWMGGHWVVPPGYGYIWEPARWENVNGAWAFYEGHWRTSEPADPVQVYQPAPLPVEETVVRTAPPAPIEEVRPAQPFVASVWVPGYWHWSGHHHVWVAGRWTARPSGYTWENHRWERRPDGHWVHHPGYWRR